MGNLCTTNPELNEVEDAKISWWRKCFFRCFRNRDTIDFGFVDVDEYDYVVEKLAIKYVRVSMFATAYDNQEYTKNENQSQNTSTVLTASVQASPIHPTNSSKPENLSARTTKKLRFSKQDGGGGSSKSDTVKKPSLAHSIGGTSPAAELMSSLAAFNSHLKESERPPKDPYSLNITKSQRSFAEELSEVAAQKNNYHAMTDSTTSASLTPSTSKQL